MQLYVKRYRGSWKQISDWENYKTCVDLNERTVVLVKPAELCGLWTTAATCTNERTNYLLTPSR